MKSILFIPVFLLSFITSIAQPKVSIGMTLEEVKKIYPNAKSDVYENTITLSIPVSFFGRDDSWGFRFEKNKLNWIFFHKYVDEISETNFTKSLYATRKIIEDFTISFGKPDSLVVGDTLFKDPYKTKHWGYDVIEAYWKNYKGMKCKIEFTFMGGKGEYHYLVSINIFDKNYPHYN